MQRCRLAVLVVTLWCVSGCDVPAGGDSAGNAGRSVFTKGLALPPGTNAIVAVRSTAAADKTLVAAQVAGVVTFRSASMVIEKVELHQVGEGAGNDADEGDDDDDEVELEGPFVVDLIAGTVTNLGHSNVNDDADEDGADDRDDEDDDNDGDEDDVDLDDDDDGLTDQADQVVGESGLLDALQLPAGTYNRIEFELASLEADEFPDHPLSGLSMVVTGDINGTPFEFCTSIHAEFELESAQDIVVQEGDLATFLISLDPPSWFSAIDPAAGVLSEDGVLRVCGDNNPELAQTVIAAMLDRARLGRDDDGDGHDDEDEDGDFEEDSEEHEDAVVMDEGTEEGPSDEADAEMGNNPEASGGNGTDDQ